MIIFLFSFSLFHRNNGCVLGNIIASETEEEIFKILGKPSRQQCAVAVSAGQPIITGIDSFNRCLGVPWQEPHERVRSQ